VGLELDRKRHDLGRAARDLRGRLDRPLTRSVDGGARLFRLQVIQECVGIEIDQLLGPHPERFGARVGSGRAAPLR